MRKYSVEIVSKAEKEYYRLRIGDYRVIYSIDDRAKVIKILSIAHRKDVYR